MAFPAFIQRQLAGPHGPLAGPMAWLLNRFNGAAYTRALAALEVAPGDHVLELGFGGGLGLEALLQRGATVVGVEPAEAMRQRARRRLGGPLRQGRLTIVDGRAEALPDGPFDRAISMNTVYFWDDVDAGFAELRRVVTERLVLGTAELSHLEQSGFREAGFRVQPPAWYVERLEEAGFEVELLPAPTPAEAVILVGS
ncbi:MAG: methyltransferase domain-containing protein [Alphaproteobacteria bacterium]|nr:methyltransferase domain-containing protein [Alphaproteobacteria bacterium]